VTVHSIQLALKSANSNFNTFLRTGTFGEVSVGMEMARAVPLLGEPSAVGHPRKGWKGLRYGDLQIWAFKDEPVYSIGIYFQGDPDLKPSLPDQLECDVPFTGRTTRAEFESYLNEHLIAWTPDLRVDGENRLRMGSCVGATFDADSGCLDCIIAALVR